MTNTCCCVHSVETPGEGHWQCGTTTRVDIRRLKVKRTNHSRNTQNNTTVKYLLLCLFAVCVNIFIENTDHNIYTHTFVYLLQFFSTKVNLKGKLVAIHTTKACTWSRSKVPAARNLDTRWTGVVNLTVQPLKNQVLIKQKGRWTPETV